MKIELFTEVNFRGPTAKNGKCIALVECETKKGPAVKAQIETEQKTTYHRMSMIDFLIEKITPVWKYKQSIVRPAAKEVIAAASQLSQEINEQTVTWYKYQEILNESAITSVKRPISGGWGFGVENSIPIEAAALALWGCRTSKRNPNRKMRIG